MKARERAERIASIKEQTAEARGDKKYLLVIEGTGWGKVLDKVMDVRETLSYEKLGIPGAEEGQAEDVEGHGKPELQFGEVDGIPVIRVKKMHAYANLSNPDAKEAMYMIIAALQDSVRGAIMTAGAGAIFCPTDREARGEKRKNAERLEEQGIAVREGKPFEPLQVGDIGVVTQILPQHVQGHRHSFTGEFTDPYHGKEKDGKWVQSGIHSHGGKWFDHAKQALETVQGRAPELWYLCTVGPDFEPPGMKNAALRDGADAIGMSLYASQVALSELGIPFEGYILITNGLGAHSHEDNSVVGEEQGEKIEGLARTAITTWPDAA